MTICSGDDGGRLQDLPRDPTCTPPGDPFIDIANANGVLSGNIANVDTPTNDGLACQGLVDGSGFPIPAAGDISIDVCDVQAAFRCIALLGNGGCGFEQPLESARRALTCNESQCTNPGFVREAAELAVVFLGDEDDCSVRRDELFGPDVSLGPANGFRCFEYGVTSADFPSAGGFDTDLGGGRDACVAKVDAAGALLWSSYLGGSDQDLGYAVAVDTSGDVYVAGTTYSSDFPTAGGFDSTLDGTSDAFVAKVDAAGSMLAWSSYLGGEDVDEGAGVGVDTAGNVFVTGYTISTGFPTAGGFDTVADVLGEGFVTKVDAAGSTLVWSSYLGGAAQDQPYGLVVDAGDDVFVTGDTFSPDFPISGGFDSIFDAQGDGFVTRIDGAAATVTWSTFLGGSDTDTGLAIAVDAGSDAYVTGRTFSTDFPTTGGFDTSSDPSGQAFVTRIDATGSSIVWSSYLGGGADWDEGLGIAVDAAQNAYVTGDTFASDFPTAGGFDTTFDVNGEAFVAKVDAAGSSLAWSSFLGGSDSDHGRGIAVDAGGANLYVAGIAASSDFPVPGGFDTSLGGAEDAFVAWIWDGPMQTGNLGRHVGVGGLRLLGEVGRLGRTIGRTPGRSCGQARGRGAAHVRGRRRRCGPDRHARHRRGGHVRRRDRRTGARLPDERRQLERLRQERRGVPHRGHRHPLRSGGGRPGLLRPHPRRGDAIGPGARPCRLRRSVRDDLNALEWTCDDGMDPVRMVSTGLREGKNLSDLIDFGPPATWRTNVVRVLSDGAPLHRTAPGVWWDNPVVTNPVEEILEAEGAVYAITTANRGYALEADRAALVVQPGVRIAHITPAMTGLASVVSDFTWIEGDVWLPDSTATDGGVLLSNTRFAVLRNMRVGAAWDAAAGECASVFLRHAVEVMRDGLGNENLLCESGETCLFSPNIGAYQGHGEPEFLARIGAGGTVENVTLLRYSENGR